MCRLYGFRASHPTRIGCHLVDAQNALLRQSQKDSIGRRHGDGWGVGYYRGSVACLKKKALPAFEDLRYSDASRLITSQTVIAHVRLGTIGSRSSKNAHPFRIRPYLFAHNGTLRGIDTACGDGEGSLTLRHQLQREILPKSKLGSEPLGETDSELMFYWIISRMFRERAAKASGFTNIEKASRSLAAAIIELDHRSRGTGTNAAAKLNFLLTDGRFFFASRLRHDLHYLHRDHLAPCVVCGETHSKALPSTIPYHSIIVASEPLTDELWSELPESSILSIDPGLRFQINVIQ